MDDNSPSSTGGLRVNDRIIEVNGVNVEKEEHPEVIARIKAVRGETRLLVVDKDTDMYYQRKGVTVSSSMPQTEHIITPDSAGKLLFLSVLKLMPLAERGLEIRIRCAYSNLLNLYLLVRQIQLQQAGNFIHFCLGVLLSCELPVLYHYLSRRARDSG